MGKVTRGRPWVLESMIDIIAPALLWIYTLAGCIGDQEVTKWMVADSGSKGLRFVPEYLST